MIEFDYAEFTTRNIGFVKPDEQSVLKRGRVFVAGVGGMGGAALFTLVRAGVGHVAIADIDTFEISNLNRQLAATLGTIGVPKTDACVNLCQQINPEIDMPVFGGEWVDQLDTITSDYGTIINGCDDVKATLALYRAAALNGATIIDAYAATLPSVYVVRPNDPRPEERMAYPTVGSPLEAIDASTEQECVLRELEYVLTHSSSRRYVDLDIATEFAAGKRSRFSFAPMVLTTGNLMAYEAIARLLGWKSRTDHKGYFLDPYRNRIERPLPALVAWAKVRIVRSFLNKMLA